MAIKTKAAEPMAVPLYQIEEGSTLKAQREFTQEEVDQAGTIFLDPNPIHTARCKRVIVPGKLLEGWLAGEVYRWIASSNLMADHIVPFLRETTGRFEGFIFSGMSLEAHFIVAKLERAEILAFDSIRIMVTVLKKNSRRILYMGSIVGWARRK